MSSWFCAMFGHDCAYDPMRLACTSGSIRLVGCAPFSTNKAFNAVFNVSLIMMNFQNLNIPQIGFGDFFTFSKSIAPLFLLPFSLDLRPHRWSLFSSGSCWFAAHNQSLGEGVFRLPTLFFFFGYWQGFYPSWVSGVE